jgi:hypothetical protein
VGYTTRQRADRLEPLLVPNVSVEHPALARELALWRHIQRGASTPHGLPRLVTQRLQVNLVLVVLIGPEQLHGCTFECLTVGSDDRLLRTRLRSRKMVMQQRPDDISGAQAEELERGASGGSHAEIEIHVPHNDRQLLRSQL